MAMLGLDIYEIDFFILDNNNPKTLVIFDQSHYLDDPEKPIYSITLPGYHTVVNIPYVINQINVINSNLLGLTNAFCNGDLIDLPDGVYEITQAVCPYTELFNTKLFLKTTRLECNYDKILLQIGSKPLEKQFKDEVINIDILIRSAKAEVKYGNREKGQEKYLAALEKVNILTKKINSR